MNLQKIIEAKNTIFGKNKKTSKRKGSFLGINVNREREVLEGPPPGNRSVGFRVEAGYKYQHQNIDSESRFELLGSNNG